MVLGHIGDAACDQALDDLAHLGDVLGGARLDETRRLARLVHVVGHQHAKGTDVRVKLLLGLLRSRARIASLCGRSG